MKPHDAAGGPSNEDIIEMSSRLTVAQMVDQLGVSKGTVQYYRRRAGVQQRPTLSHKKYMPWELHRSHAWTEVRMALVAWSKEAQGVELDRREQQRLRKLRDHLTKYDVVVDYDRDTINGWSLVPRDPKIDDPDMPIRQPSLT